MKKGFTLIELLVVVLIIGVLSAIALPQYQAATDRARYSGLMVMTRAIKDAQERYRLANGEYSTDLRLLDISLPDGGVWSGGGSRVEYDSGEIYWAGEPAGGWRVHGQNHKALSNTILLLTFFDRSSSVYASQTFCYVYGQDRRAAQVCKSLGGVLQYSGCSSETSCEAYRIS